MRINPNGLEYYLDGIIVTVGLSCMLALLTIDPDKLIKEGNVKSVVESIEKYDRLNFSLSNESALSMIDSGYAYIVIRNIDVFKKGLSLDAAISLIKEG